MAGDTEAALHARNLARLRASPEIRALGERAPDLELWLFGILDADPDRKPRERRDALLREVAPSFGRSRNEQAERLAALFRRYREGRLGADDALLAAAVFSQGAPVPRSARHLLRILSAED